MERTNSGNSENWDSVATSFHEMSDLHSETDLLRDPFTELIAEGTIAHNQSDYNLSSNLSKNDITVRFTSVKKIGSKLRGLALHQKITQTGPILADNQIFKARTTYWFAVDYPCSLITKALGNSSKQKELRDLNVKEQLTFENGATLFQVSTQKQAGLHQMQFIIESTRITTKIIRVVTDSALP